VYIARQDRAADYRRQAEEARAMAQLISLNDAKDQLLEIAKHLEMMADLKEREARKLTLARHSEPET
jgi:hypothetical protein